MIVDTSAVVAILFNESEGDRCLRAILEDDSERLMSAANALELAIVIDRHGTPTMQRKLDGYTASLGIALAPVTASHYDIARSAYREFGRGSGHPAKLNYGDCFAYALAIEQDEPLLYVGDDFSHTDVRSALPR